MREKNSKRCLSLILAIYLLTSYKELSMANDMNPTKIPVKIGLILDKSSWAGMMGLNCVSFALSDFYASHGYYRTRLVLHFRDSKDSVIGAASAGSFFLYLCLSCLVLLTLTNLLSFLYSFRLDKKCGSASHYWSADIHAS